MTGQALPKEQNSLDANMEETTPTSSTVSGSSTTSGTETASTPTTLLGAELFVDTEDPHSDGTDRAIVAGGVLGTSPTISSGSVMLIYRCRSSYHLSYHYMVSPASDESELMRRLTPEKTKSTSEVKEISHWEG